MCRLLQDSKSHSFLSVLSVPPPPVLNLIMIVDQLELFAGFHVCVCVRSCLVRDSLRALSAAFLISSKSSAASTWPPPPACTSSPDSSGGCAGRSGKHLLTPRWVGAMGASPIFSSLSDLLLGFGPKALLVGAAGLSSVSDLGLSSVSHPEGEASVPRNPAVIRGERG